MRDEGLAVRRVTEADLELALDWAAAEGWNPGLHDAHCFHAADPGGFFLGELDGAPVGRVSAVRYGSAFGFLGLYIVKPEHRGRGFGLKALASRAGPPRRPGGRPRRRRRPAGELPQNGL